MPRKCKNYAKEKAKKKYMTICTEKNFCFGKNKNKKTIMLHMQEIIKESGNGCNNVGEKRFRREWMKVYEEEKFVKSYFGENKEKKKRMENISRETIEKLRLRVIMKQRRRDKGE